MAKKRISSVDLSYVIHEQLREDRSIPSTILLAVVSDSKDGWRVVVGKRSRSYVSPEGARRLEAIQRKLRAVYQLDDS